MAGIGHNRPPAQGYILIFRSLLNHPVVGMMQPVKQADPKKPSASRMEAWIDLLMMAVYEPETVTVNGHKYDLERGDQVCAVSFLSKRWNWTKRTVEGFIKRLSDCGMLEKKGLENGKAKDKRPAHLSVCNYSQYQDGAQEVDFEKGNRKGNRSGNKKDKEKAELSRCKRTINMFPESTQGKSEWERKGEKKGEQYKQNKTNITKLANSESSRENAVVRQTANEIMLALAGWIYKDSFEGKMEPNGKPLPNHFQEAEILLKSNAAAYGSQVVKEAYAEMRATLLTKHDVRNHTKLFIAMCRQARDRYASNSTSNDRKKIEAIIGARH